MNAICLVADRLHVGYLGCYGNDLGLTPTIDRLACEGVVFDQAFVLSPTMADFAHAAWSGLHPLAENVAELPTLPQLLGAAGIHTSLVTDDAEIAESPIARDFAEIVRLPAPARRVATTIDETGMASLFAELIRHIAALEQPWMVWVHTSGLGTVWDAPLEIRHGLIDEDEPSPTSTAEPPNFFLADDHDPDDLLGLRRAYAGQVMLWDMCLAGLVAALEADSLWNDTLLSVVAPRGCSLGEHGRVGPCDEPLFAEVVHVPWLLRLPEAKQPGGRTQQLVHTADVPATLLDVWQLQQPPTWTGRSVLPLMSGEGSTWRDRLAVRSPSGELAIRTPAWYTRMHASAGQRARQGPRPATGTVELYAKPDDRWDKNDVADLCPEIATLAVEELCRLVASIRAGNGAKDPPIDPLLTELPD